MIICQGLFFISCSTSPGIITPTTQSQFDHQIYDGTVFVDGNCTTCGTKKVKKSQQ